MLIRSKDKTILIDCKNLVINDDATIMAIISDTIYFKLGKYKTLDEAKLVLDDTQKHFSKCFSPAAYQMPETATELLPIEEINLSVRSYNLLKGVHINTVHDLLQADLNHIRGIGRKSIKEIEEVIKKYETNDL